MNGAKLRVPQLILLPLLTVMFLSSGCAYFKDRVNDLTDIGGAKVVVGRGFRFAASINNEKSLGVGYWDFRKYGWDGRSFGQMADSGQEYVFNVERELEALCGTHSIYCLEEELHGAYEEANHILPPVTFRNIGDLQITFAPPCFGLEVNVSVAQICDFVLGIFCIDAAGDDWNMGTKQPSWVMTDHSGHADADGHDDDGDH